MHSSTVPLKVVQRSELDAIASRLSDVELTQLLEFAKSLVSEQRRLSRWERFHQYSEGNFWD
jgi:hypothetical protein